MATYEETIVLKDEVSATAKRASEAVSLLSSGLSTVGTRLSKVMGADAPFEKAAASAERFAESLTKALALQQALAGTKIPAIPAASQNGPAAASTGAASSPLGSSGALVPKAAPANLTQKMLVDQGNTKPIKMPVQLGPINADGLKMAQAAAGQLKSKLEAAKMEMVKAQALGDDAGFGKALTSAQKYSSALAQLPAPIEKTGGASKSLSKSMWDARNAMDVGKQSIGAAVAGISAAFTSLAQGDVKGTVAGITDAVAGMAKMLDLVAPGLGQVVSTIITIAGGLAGALAGGVIEGMKFAVASSQAKQQMLSMFDAMGNGVVSGEELDDMLSSLSDRIGITKDKLAPLTQAFLQMGVKGKDQLEKLTLAAISAQAIVGDPKGAAAFTELQKKIQLAAETSQGFKLGTRQLVQLSEAGVTVTDVAAKMGLTTKDLAAQLEAGSVDAKKFGNALTEAVITRGAKPLERLGSSFGAIKEKFLQSIGDMFEDIDVGPFMAAVKDLFSIFGANTHSGEALKAGIGGFFKETFAIATQLVPVVKHFLLDLVIWGLKAYLAVKPIVKSIQEFFASATGSAVLSAVLDVLWSALKGIGVVLLIVVGLFTVMAVMTVAVGLAIWAVIGALFSLGTTITTAVVGAIASVVEALAGWVAGAPQVATDFIMGLVNGITAGAALVKNAVTSLASGAIGAITGKFDSHSPSKVMVGIGGDVTDGLAGGIDGGAIDVHGAASSMASMAVAGVADAPAPTLAAPGATGATGAAGAASSSSGASVVIESIVINGANKSLEEISLEAISIAFQHAVAVAG